MTVSILSYDSGLIASWGLSKCRNPAPKGSWLPPFKTACSNRCCGWNIPMKVSYRDISLMESVPLLWHLPPVLNKSGATFSFPTTLPFVRFCLLSSETAFLEEPLQGVLVLQQGILWHICCVSTLCLALDHPFCGPHPQRYKIGKCNMPWCSDLRCMHCIRQAF